jgi:hypothetical protein
MGKYVYAKRSHKIPNGHNIYTPTSFIAIPSKIYPNWNFWFENKPSGNPASLSPSVLTMELGATLEEACCKKWQHFFS